MVGLVGPIQITEQYAYNKPRQQCRETKN